MLCFTGDWHQCSLIYDKTMKCVFPTWMLVVRHFLVEFAEGIAWALTSEVFFFVFFGWDALIL